MSSGVYKRIKPSNRKGKTYEEFYGVEKAKELREKCVSSHIGKKLSKEQIDWLCVFQSNRPRRRWTQEEKLYMSNKKKGYPAWNKDMKLEDMVGVDKAISIKNRLREARLKQIIPNKDTKIEVLLQQELLQQGVEFQKHIPLLNKYQVDIYLPRFLVVIEADGRYWHKVKDGGSVEQDKKRDNELATAGYTVFRFDEELIKKDAKVCIDTVIKFIQKDYEIVRATAIDKTVETDRNIQSLA